MTEQDLLAAGYRRFPNPGLFRTASHFYQRPIWEDDKKAYFLNVYVYPPNSSRPYLGLEAEAQLYLTGDRWLTLEFHHVESQTVELMEALFFEAWVKLGGVHDPHNND